ncbi:CsbD family protein [Paracoccus benzoatiresistens]|uniref:CsbD family protein n=1 Tax=Paracoccus benzoatiresistens TaxID=2997341 RepID=A0ABT4J5N0_9RHOB|nr:CsbD family protein [Paracoccus sp. EF6]MCZ0961955.1 CsbD family protein [Paracoccus sp. EF6]
MNWDIIQGKWKQVKGSVQEKWGELTNDELDQINGNKDQLAGKLQEKYGWTKNDAEREIDDYFRDRTF